MTAGRLDDEPDVVFPLQYDSHFVKVVKTSPPMVFVQDVKSFSYYLDAVTLEVRVPRCELPPVRDICGWETKVCYLTQTNEVIIFDVKQKFVGNSGYYLKTASPVNVEITN